jgi:starch synthase
MRRASLIFLGFFLAVSASAQIRVALPEARLGLSATGPGVAPTAGSPSAALSLSPSAFAAAPPLAAPVLTAGPATAAALPVAAALPAAAVPAASMPAAVSPAAAAPATPKPLVTHLTETFLPGKDASGAANEAKAAAAFDGGKPLNIMMVGAESVPFIKTGGLADVVDALARGMVERGHRVMMVLPKYRQLKLDGVDLKPAGQVSVPIGGVQKTANLLTAKVNGVDVVLLDNPEYYDRKGGPYDGNGSVYTEDGNDERFAFFSRAALEAARVLSFKTDVVHAHDWHAALIPAFLKEMYASDPMLGATKSVMTIHNIAYQGIYGIDRVLKLGFDRRLTESMKPLEFWGHTNFLKAGLSLADAVTTVSPTYAKEIVSGPEFGMHLEGVLKGRPDGVHGIINGLDPALWDPSTDRVLIKNYGPADVAEGKAANKAWLQKRLGLEQKAEVPVFAIASRLAHQKGIDLVIAAIDELVARGAQVVVTGSGEKPLEAALASAVKRHAGKVASHPFDEDFVRIVYAAADFLFMPSRFEPCGLSQLIAHRYGTLPIVTPTGGLVDTVRDLRDDAQRGDGIIIRDFTVLALVEAAEAAIAGYGNPEALAAARSTAMANDSSWGPSLAAYEALYRRAIGDDSASRAASAAPGTGESASSTNSASDARRDGSIAP